MKITHCLAALAATISLALLYPFAVSAQEVSVDLGGGLAGVENYDPVTPAAALSVLWQPKGRVAGSLAYHHWFGDDGNSGDPGATFGNDAFNLSVLYELVPGGGISWLLGAGFGQYERRVELFNGDVDHVFDGAVTLTTMLRWVLRPDIDAFLRADVSARTTEYEPDWGFAIVGIGFDL